MNPTEPVSPSPITPVPSGSASPDISRVENLVAAAQQEAAVQAGGPVPGQAPVEGPKKDFENQFGSGVSVPPPASEPAPDLMDAALEGLGTQPPAAPTEPIQQPQTDNLVSEQTQPVVETLAQPGPEQTPAEKAENLKQEIAAKIDAFLEEVTKEKVAV